MTFLSPSWLWLLLAVPLVALVRTRVPVPMHAAVRMLVLALLVVALARPALWTIDDRDHAVFVADLSPSTAPAAKERATQALLAARRALPAEAQPALVVIGDAGDELRRAFPTCERIEQGSPLSRALARAALAIPEGARGSVTVVADGLATDRRFGDALAALQERGLPVHVVPLPAASHAPRIASLYPVRPPRAGHTVELELEVVGDGSSVRAVVAAPEGPIGEVDVALQDGRGRARVAWEPRAPGFVPLEVRVEGHTLRRTVAVQEPLRGLYLGQRIVRGFDEVARLVGPGVRLDAWDGGEGAPVPPLEGYDVVILDDVPAEVLGAERRADLVRQVVQRGLGLVVTGGEASFGPGGYADTELDPLLPIESVQKEEKRDPSTTLVVIIDTSGSMVGERVQLAKEIARLAMMRLLPHDKVGIVEFYGNKRWAAPIQPASNSIDLARALNRMEAGGGTVIYPALEEAFYGMQNVQTRYKHVLILTDGGVESGPFEPLLRRMADEGMAVSTVLIGAETHSEFLVNVANWGKGRFYAATDRFNLPEILLKQPTTSRLPAYKPGRFPVAGRGGPGWWGGVAPTDLPPVAGYVESNLRPGAEALIEVQGERDPLLATWRYGLGRVTALLTEPAGPGTEPWREWPGYGPLFARVVTRTADDGRAAFGFELVRRGETLELIATRRRPGDERPFARPLDQNGREGAPLAWQQRAPGVFLAQWVAEPAAEVRLVAGTDGAPDQPLQRLCSSPREDERDELAVHPTAGLDLAAVAAATGGDRVALDALAGLRPRAGGPSEPPRLRDLAPLALLLALGLYVFDVFHRRRDRRLPAVSRSAA